jgi:hypothetical protein
MGQGEAPPSFVFGESEIEMAAYRRRTITLLRRYAKSSVEVGRLPSMLGREFFRSQVSSYTMRNFEDVVIFVTDMEYAIKQLRESEKKLLAMNVVEEYSLDEVARLLGRNRKTIQRQLADALDRLSRILLTSGLMDELEFGSKGRESPTSCQEAKKGKLGVSESKESQNKPRKFVLPPPDDLIS